MGLFVSMLMTIISWNVRGLGRKKQRSKLKNFLKDYKASVVCLQETMLSGMDTSMVRSIWGGNFVDWIHLDAVGTSGGILLMWDKKVVERLDVEIGSFTVSCKFQNVEDGFCWVFTGVYGPNRDEERSGMWDELVGLGSFWGEHWCVGGDFNVTRFPSERSGGTRITATMAKFSDSIDEMSLMDYPLKDGKFTWSDNHTQPSFSRIDRFLVSSGWDEHFDDAIQSVLPRVLSDHSPLLLKCGGLHRGKSPFCFKNMWLSTDGFMVLVKGWWDSFEFRGNPSFILAQKLKALKDKLKVWNKDVFGDTRVQKQALLREIQTLDNKEESSVLTEVERNRRLEVREEFGKIALLEEISWRQKSRAISLQEGDKNTKFFSQSSQLS